MQLFENYDFRTDFGNDVNFFSYNSTSIPVRYSIYGVTKDGRPDDKYRPYFDQTLIFIYYGLTTLATIGFGDYSPISDLEKVLGMGLFLIGSIVFAFLMGVFIKLIKKFLNLDIEFDD